MLNPHTGEYDDDYDPYDDPDYDPTPCCPDPGCPGNPCTFPGYATNH